jgi:nucleoside-diphosphate-sugar epimerase
MKEILRPKILILGVNGFIGNHLTKALLNEGYPVFGIDIESHKLDNDSLCNPSFHFCEGDITIHKEWVHYHITKCDIILPLVAIANPALYVKEPLRVFELDFEANLEIIRLCVKYKKRLIFPSTSEVYGMCQDEAFDEECSNFVVGPIAKSRWIYSCSKQLLDRIIHSYGLINKLNYTLVRPFNWIGPKLDSILNNQGLSRVLTQFISDILFKNEIKLVDGGIQRRCFTDIDDGIRALLLIIAHNSDLTKNQIFNIGNPLNDVSIKDLALLLVDVLREVAQEQGNHKLLKQLKNLQVKAVSSKDYYGDLYEDINHRVPKIEKAKKLLNWEPCVALRDSLRKTVIYQLSLLESADANCWSEN